MVADDGDTATAVTVLAICITPRLSVPQPARTIRVPSRAIQHGRAPARRFAIRALTNILQAVEAIAYGARREVSQDMTAVPNELLLGLSSWTPHHVRLSA